MKVGEIFIQLGFEVQGQSQASGFQSIVDSIAQSTAELVDAIGDLRQEFIEQMEGTKKVTAVVQKKEKQVQANTKAVKENKVAIGQQVSELWKARLGFVGVGAAIMYATQKASAYAQALNIFSNVTGLSSQELQKWEQNAAAAGITAEEMASTVRNLQKAGTDVMMGQGNTKPWAFLGLKPSQDPFATLEQLKKALKSVPTALGSRMAEELGLSDAMISFLHEADALPGGDEGLILNEKELKRLKQFNIYFNQTMDNVKREMRKFGVAMAPIADSMLYGFTRITKAVRTISEIFSKLDGSSGGNFFKSFIVAATILAAALFPTVFALGALALVVDEVTTYMRGGDTVIGSWIEQFKTLKGWVDGVAAVLATIANVLTMGLMKKEIDERMFEIADQWKLALGMDLGPGAKTPTGYLDEKSLAQRDANDRASLFKWVPGGDPANRGAASVTNNVNIQVDGSKDPKATATEVSKALNKTTAESIRQMPIGEGAQ